MIDYQQELASHYRIPKDRIRLLSITLVRDGFAIIYRWSQDERTFKGECYAAFWSDKHQKILHTAPMRDPIHIGDYEGVHQT